MSKENEVPEIEPVSTEAVDTVTNPATPEVVEIPWDDAKEIIAARKSIFETESFLAQLILDHEKKKRSLMLRLESQEAEMYATISEIQEKHSVDPHWTYEFKLPTQEGEKAYFIRKHG